MERWAGSKVGAYRQGQPSSTRTRTYPEEQQLAAPHLMRSLFLCMISLFWLTCFLLNCSSVSRSA